MKETYTEEEITAAMKFVKETFSLAAYDEGFYCGGTIEEARKDPLFWLATKLQGMTKEEAEWWLNDAEKRLKE